MGLGPESDGHTAVGDKHGMGTEMRRGIFFKKKGLFLLMVHWWIHIRAHPSLSWIDSELLACSW